MKLGELQTLRVEKTVPFGVYLTGEDPEEGRVLLPRSQVPAGTSEGDELEVFLYKDSEDRMIATRPARGSKRDRKCWWRSTWTRASGSARP